MSGPRPRALLAPDKLKGSLTSVDAAEALSRGVRSAGASGLPLPLADGGEGTLRVLHRAWGGTLDTLPTVDALGRRTQAQVGMPSHGRIVLEAASCLGLADLGTAADVTRASSRGLGLLMRSALSRRPRELIIALGGTANMDGGAGLLEALGARFDDGATALAPLQLSSLRRVDLSAAVAALSGVRVRVLCDVETPLSEAAVTYGPQKGASLATAADLQRALDHFGALLGPELGGLPHGGAAGGIGAALAALGGELMSGSDGVLDAVNFDALLTDADFVITAEGRLDATSLRGKVIGSVAARCRRAGRPLFVIAGSLAADDASLQGAGVSAAFALAPGPCSLEQSTRHASVWLEHRAQAVAAAFIAGRQSSGKGA
ncbi:MAG: glycerate kinase [Polyangiaceae bacterium]